VEALKALPIILVMGIFVMAVYHGKKPLPNKGDQVALPVTNRTFYGMEVNDDTSKADIKVTHLPSGNSWGISLYDDGVYQDPKQSTNSSFKYEYSIHYKPLSVGIDLGWWGGVISTDTGEEENRHRACDMGIRVSPARLLYGTLAPDLLVGTENIGIGASFYLPTGVGKGLWKKIGIGGAWMAGYHGGGGWMPFVSVTTTF
jgi:hypothetical protein